MEDITYKPSVKAQLRIHVQTPDGPKEKPVSIKDGDDLFARSNERAAYAQGYEVAEINAGPDSEFIRFTNGRTMRIWSGPNDFSKGALLALFRLRWRASSRRSLASSAK